MDAEESASILKSVLDRFQGMSYCHLVRLVEDSPELNNTCYEEVTAESGNWYQVRIDVFWDDKPKGDVRVLGAIDDGGWRAFAPRTSDFILNSKGEFVDE